MTACIRVWMEAKGEEVETSTKKAPYEGLYRIPENTTGEIIEGELMVTPRPPWRNVRTVSVLGAEVIGPYDLGEGDGPGAWIILIEPELGPDQNIVVPDLEGGKRSDFQPPRITTGSRWLRTGSVSFFHPARPRSTKSVKCRSARGMAF